MRGYYLIKITTKDFNIKKELYDMENTKELRKYLNRISELNKYIQDGIIIDTYKVFQLLPL